MFTSEATQMPEVSTLQPKSDQLTAARGRVLWDERAADWVSSTAKLYRVSQPPVSFLFDTSLL